MVLLHSLLHFWGNSMTFKATGTYEAKPQERGRGEG